MGIGNSIERLLFLPHREHSIQAVIVPFGSSSAYLMGRGCFTRRDRTRCHFWPVRIEMRVHPSDIQCSARAITVWTARWSAEEDLWGYRHPRC